MAVFKVLNKDCEPYLIINSAIHSAKAKGMLLVINIPDNNEYQSCNDLGNSMTLVKDPNLKLKNNLNLIEELKKELKK